MTVLFGRRLNNQAMLVTPATATVTTPTSLSVALSLTNGKTTAVASNAPITIGHSFAPGDVAAGSHLTIDGMVVQQDQEAYWGDGSLKFAALALRDTARTYGPNGGGADTRTIQLGVATGLPNRTAAFTLQQYLAANDHRLVFSGLDCGTDTYVISPATIVQNGTLEPWDAGGVTLPNGCAQGTTTITVSDASHISTGQAISTDGRVGKTLLANNTPTVFVSSKSGNTITLSGAMPISVAAGGKLFFNTPICGYRQIRSGQNCMEWMFWSYLQVSSGANAGKYHCQVRCSFYVRAWGPSGPFELDALVENSNVFGNHPFGAAGPTTATQSIRLACNIDLFNGSTRLCSWGGVNDPRAMTIPASNISSQSGVATNSSVWPLDSGTGMQFTAAPGGSLPGGLSPNTPYWIGGANGQGIYPDRRSSLAEDSNNVTISSAGSGNIYAWPFVNVFGMCAENLATNTAEPVWDPGSSGIAVRPHLMPTHDQSYLIKSKAVPPFDWTRNAIPRTSCRMSDRGVFADLSTFYPGQPQPWGSPWNISQYGDDPGDDRVGLIRQVEAELYFNQTNTFSDMLLRCSARRFFHYCANFKNERAAMPVVNSIGPNKDYVQYPGLAPTLTTTNGPEAAGNAPQYFAFQGASFGGANGSGNQNTYGPAVDASHLPCVGAGAYHRYGHRLFLDQMQQVCGTLNFANPYWSLSVNNKSYCSPLMAEHSEQIRGLAWRLKLFSQAEYYSPDADFYKPYLTDALNDNGNFLTDWLVTRDSWKTGVGLYNVYGNDSNVPLYMASFLGFVTAFVAWRDMDDNRRPGYKNWLQTHFRKLVLDLWDTDGAGGMYRVNIGSLIFSSNQNDTSTVAQTTAALWSLNGVSSPAAAGIWNGDNSNSFLGSYPFDTTVYGTIAYACWSMSAWIGLPKAQTLCDRLRTTLSVSPYKPIKWTDGANAYYNADSPQAFMPWCIRPPVGNSL